VGSEARQRRLFESLKAWSQAPFDPLYRQRAGASAGATGVADALATRRVSAPGFSLSSLAPSTSSATINNAEEKKSGNAASSDRETAARREYERTLQPFIAHQVGAGSRQELAPSLFERNTTELVIAHERERDWEAGDVAARRARSQRELSRAVAEAFRRGEAAAKRAQGAKSLEDIVSEMMGASGLGAFARRTRFEQESEHQAQMVTSDGGVTAVGTDGNREEEDEDELRRRREAELNALREQLAALQGEIGGLRDGAEQGAAAIRHMESELGSILERTKELEDAYKVKKRTLDLLPEADENLRKLQEIAAASSQRLVALGAEWETHREPLVARYRRKKEQLRDRKDAARDKLDEIREMRAEMKELSSDLREKDELHRQVLAELERMPQSINRQVYVRRIMDILRNLERQKVDIQKILEDVRVVQRDINLVSEKSKRSFAVTDELIFSAANVTDKKGQKDPAATRSYRLLVELRQGFDRLVQVVEEMGRAKNDIRALTSQIETLEARNTGLSMEKIKADLDAVAAENKQLAAHLQEFNGGAQR
jgi:chromosome segregation ATPase